MTIAKNKFCLVIASVLPITGQVEEFVGYEFGKAVVIDGDGGRWWLPVDAISFDVSAEAIEAAWSLVRSSDPVGLEISQAWPVEMA
jgi:hypothetical protein